MPEGLPGEQPQVCASPGYDEAVIQSDPGDTRSPGRHLSAASQPPRLTRSRKATIAIVLAIAASEVGLGLVLTHPPAHHLLASPSPAGSARARHAPRRPATSPSSPPSPKPSRSSRHRGLVPRGLISFEDGTDGWKPLFGSIRSSQTAQVAYSGTHSLLITARSTYSAVGVENGLADLRSGDKVTFHIYSDGQNGGSVLPFAERWNRPEVLADKVQLPSHPGWFTLTWVVPSVSEVDAIGIQIVHHGRGPLTLAVDALTWPGS